MKYFFFIFLVALSSQLIACNINSPKNQFSLAEELFNEKKYDASVHEFDKIMQKDPQGEYGIKALFMIAGIQHIYLNAPDEAIKSYKLLLKRSSDKSLNRDIQKNIATIYFEQFENYDKAADAYKALIEMNNNDPDIDFFMFRLARAYFLQSKFNLAIETLEELKTKFPDSKHAHKAELEIANSLNAQGKFSLAIKKYEEVAVSNDKELKNIAIFEMANSYEALDDLDKSYDLLASIQQTYPNPGVITLKMQKIKRRKILRRR